jgi:hypothetical protein
MIDAGAFLTTTTAAGSGTRIPVADAGYFYGGHGIPGELGDEIQLQGQTTIARVVYVDVVAKRLTVDRSLSWSSGKGVALRYSGTRPDMGAFEYTGTQQATSYTLTVARTGSGAGSVTSSPAGISCGTDCSQTYSSGTVVTLTQQAAAGSTFFRWTGECYGTGPCEVTMSRAKWVWAEFKLATSAVALANGTGAVTTSEEATAGIAQTDESDRPPRPPCQGRTDPTVRPAGIDCGDDCAEPYNHGTGLVLTPVPAAGSKFAGWSGACSGAGPCRVRMDGSRDVTATFSLRGATAPPGDFDGDGKQDLLWRNQRTGRLKAWLLDRGSMTADPSLTPDGVADTEWHVVGVGDLNGDGHTDILWQQHQTRELRAWLMDRTTLASTLELAPGSFGSVLWQVRGLADFDGDGHADVLWQHRKSGSVYAWLTDGATAAGGAYLVPESEADASWRIEGLADFDGDEQADVLWRHRQTGDLRVSFMSGLKAARVSDLVPSRVADRRWRIVRVADLNEDGRADILWHRRDTGDLLVWYMNGITMTSRAPLAPSQFLDPDWTAAPSAGR